MSSLNLDQIYDVLDELDYSSDYIPTIGELNEHSILSQPRKFVPYLIDLQRRLFIKKRACALNYVEAQLLDTLSNTIASM